MITYIYIDESGDLGFNFNKKGTSEYFTISLVLFNSKQHKDIAARSIKKTIKRKLNRKKAKRIKEEIKGNSTSISIKKYLFDEIKKQDGMFEIYSITFNKFRVTLNLQNNKHRLYNWIVKKLIDQISIKDNCQIVEIILDKCKNEKQIRDCNKYLIAELSQNIDLSVKINVSHRDSKIDTPLQIADIAANGLQRKHEQTDKSVHEIIKEFLQYEELYFE